MARKILLADDSVTAQNMGRRILTDAGYEVVTVSNGSAALKKIAEQLPELIVLDVYMPGYSGLEVCQRLKETRETSRIPVLLTVGKLEPFKPEEARRARADAFIVKPFEASELLTALTKLEDKIVPQPAAQKGGQFAKVWASLEHGSASPGKGEKFGDSETGWKNRLVIPPPHAKHEEPEPEEVKPAKDSKKQEKSAAKETRVEAPTIAGVPPDITPEEVAAIAAAAAAFEEAQPVAREFVVTEAEVPDEPPATFASAPSAEEESKPAEVEAVSKTPAASEAAAPVAEAAPAAPAEPANAAEEEAPEKPADVKVEAVAEMPPVSTEEAESKAATPAEPVVAAVAAAPRWVAEECGLEPGETNVILEEEMRKAYAVLQAATSEADFSVSAVAEAPAPAVMVESPAPVEATPEPPPVEAVPELAPVIVPEPAAAVPEPVAAPEPEPVVAVEPVPVAAPEPAVVAETPAPEPEPAPAPPAAVAEIAVQPEAAVAAAAAAGSVASEPIPLEAVAQAAVPAATATEPEVSATKPADTELAAAWAQWKEIRESVVGSGIAAQITEVAAAELKHAQAEVQAEAQPAEEASSSGNPANIANIVDSVLAELKPKLVEEIAKKLGRERKK